MLDAQTTTGGSDDAFFLENDWLTTVVYPRITIGSVLLFPISRNMAGAGNGPDEDQTAGRLA